MAADPPPSQRLIWIDIARGLAALSVVVYHLRIGEGLARTTGWGSFEWLSRPGWLVAVPLFFVISGFSIHYAERRRLIGWRARGTLLRAYLFRRFWRIYPPYLFALFVSLLIGLALGQAFSFPDLLAHIFMVHQFVPAYFNTINVVLWSVGVEVWLYLLYPLVGWLFEEMGLIRTGARVAVTSVGGVFCVGLISSSYNPVGFWFVLDLLFSWCLGAALAEVYAKERPFFCTPWWWATGAAIFAGYLALHYLGAFKETWWPLEAPLRTGLCAWPLSLLLIWQKRSRASRREHLVVKTLGGMGLISYSLYLLHQPLIDLRSLILPFLPSGWPRQSLVVAWFGVPFFAAWLSWKYIEMPSVKLNPWRKK